MSKSLDEKDNYTIALIGFYSENNLHNLRQDAYLYIENFPGHLRFNSGYWTLQDIQRHIDEFILSKKTVGDEMLTLEKDGNRIKITSHFKLRMDSVLSDLLGFTYSDEYRDARKDITVENISNLRGLDVIEIHCDIVDNSFANHDDFFHKHKETSILYHFYPNVPHGYKISEKPHTPHYVPLKKDINKIQQIKIAITDQDNVHLLNSDVQNIVYLDLVRV